MGQRSARSAICFWHPSERRERIAEVIVQCEGNLLKTAYMLGIHRSHMYRLTYMYRLWPVINAARREKMNRIEVERLIRGARKVN